MVKYMMLFSCVMAITSIVGNAHAQKGGDVLEEQEFEDIVFDRSVDPDSVDAWEAIAYSKLAYSTTDEYGVDWDVYWDKEQQIMWAVIGGTPRDVILERYEKTGRLDNSLPEEDPSKDGDAKGRCAYYMMAPHFLQIDTGSGTDTYTSFTYAVVSGYPTYTAEDSGSYTNISGYVYSVGKNIGNYCTNYQGRYMDWDSGGFNWATSDNQACGWGSLLGRYYYNSYEASDISGESAWDYGPDPTWVTKHKYYACSAYREMRTRYATVPVK